LAAKLRGQQFDIPRNMIDNCGDAFYDSMSLENSGVLLVTPSLFVTRSMRYTEDCIMKRLHVHLSVENLEQSIRFYSTLFATKPSVTKPDYAKWMLDDPRVNFAISSRGRRIGLDHLGIQVEEEAELAEVYARLKQAEGPILEQGATTCCYAKSEKSWIVDPQGLSWETFLTTGESTVYGEGGLSAVSTRESAACCAPTAADIAAVTAATSSCCSPATTVAVPTDATNP
jgi:catechol 2,3-dioxygenase-like lactoylglutathione lyase family enzyme